jgi:hypothetical protein
MYISDTHAYWRPHSTSLDRDIYVCSGETGRERPGICRQGIFLWAYGIGQFGSRFLAQSTGHIHQDIQCHCQEIRYIVRKYNTFSRYIYYL